MLVDIDRSGCISCGLCVETCPEVFQFADDGLANVHAQPDQDNEEGAREAAENCPVSVIHAQE